MTDLKYDHPAACHLRLPRASAAPENIREIADSLDEGFVWEGSPQGNDYWHDVCTNLRALVDEIEATARPTQPEPTALVMEMER